MNRAVRAFLRTNPNSPSNQYDGESLTQSTISTLPTTPPVGQHRSVPLRGSVWVSMIDHATQREKRLGLKSCSRRCLRNAKKVGTCSIVPTGSAHWNSLTLHPLRRSQEREGTGQYPAEPAIKLLSPATQQTTNGSERYCWNDAKNYLLLDDVAWEVTGTFARIGMDLERFLIPQKDSSPDVDKNVSSRKTPGAA